MEAKKYEIIKQIKNICKKNKREINPEESAKHFYDLGLLFKTEGLQQKNKIKLVQTAGLLNASIYRNPKDVEEIKQDLKQFCLELLKVAKAENQTADLFAYSDMIAEDVKQMRKEVNAKLKDIPLISEYISDIEFTKLKGEKVEAIRSLQNGISENYTRIMKRIGGFCEEIMGNPLCKYALVGLGSLSRKEITPYSDFEHIIILEDKMDEQEKIKDYFRWFSVIFQVILINLRETNISRLHIPGLRSKNPVEFYDAVTPFGISFDGMMPHACKFPLGGQVELIQTVSKMARFIGSDKDLKNDYHLSDMLMTSCFVAGDQGLFEDFQHSVDKELALLNWYKFVLSVGFQIKKNQDLFFLLSQLTLKDSPINVKSMVYRSSTIFVSAIGKIHKIKKSCCFDILEELQKMLGFSKKIGDDLKFAIAVACETRLRIYMDNESQNDVIPWSQIQKKFVKIVGVKSLVEYFGIIDMFQDKIFELDKMSEQKRPTYFLASFHLRCYEYGVHQATKHISKLENSQDAGLSKKKRAIIAYCHFINGACNLNLEKYDRALTDFKTYQSRQITENLQLINEADFYNAFGCCYYELGQYNVALENFEESVKIFKSTKDRNASDDIAHGYYWFGLCKFRLERFTEAIEDLLNSIEKSEQIERASVKSRYFAKDYYWIGLCKIKLDRYKEALTYFEDSIRIREEIDDNPSKSNDVAECHFQIGVCQYNLLKFDKAIKNLQLSLTITLLIARDLTICIDVPNFQFHIENYKNEPSKCKRILTKFQNTLKVSQLTRKERTSCLDVSNCYFYFGKCKYELHQYQETLTHFQISHSIKLLMTEDPQKSNDIACGYFEIGKCEYKLGQYREGCLNLQTSLGTYLIAAPTDYNVIFEGLYLVGLCKFNLSQYEEALVNLQTSFVFYYFVSKDSITSSIICDCYYHICLCKYKLRKQVTGDNTANNSNIQ